MILYTILLVLYVGLLLFIKPAPKSFRDEPITIKENFLAIKGSLFLGVLLLTIHLFVSDFTSLDASEKSYQIFALNNLDNNRLWLLQYFTHLFIHLNLLHLVGNLTMLGLLSAYERRVGLGRYLAVLLVSGLVSGLSVFFYSENIYSSGISGALFGLGAAFFTDENNLTLKDWIYAILVFFVLVAIVSLRDFYEMQKLDNVNFRIDYFAHILGALGAIAYTRFIRQK
jgi:rhomboid protease GluP